MKTQIQESLWRQFGASIDMLINVVSNCTEEYLVTNKRFYLLAYHTVVFLDYYLSIPPTDFSPVLKFTIKDEDQRPSESIGNMVPDRVFSRHELIDYLSYSRVKCKKLIESLSDAEKFNLRFTEGNQEGDMDYSILEILLYNLRHTQHHTGQLNLIMRQELNQHMEWVFRVGELN